MSERVVTPTALIRSQEAENQIFLGLIAKYGAVVLEERMRKTESYRTYYRRWPFDGKKLPVDLELVQDFLEDKGPGPDEQVIMAQARDEWLEGLTDKQLEVALQTERGLKPRDIAKLQGKKSSGSTRYLLHSVRKKMEKKNVNQVD